MAGGTLNVVGVFGTALMRSESLLFLYFVWYQPSYAGWVTREGVGSWDVGLISKDLSR